MNDEMNYVPEEETSIEERIEEVEAEPVSEQEAPQFGTGGTYAQRMYSEVPKPKRKKKKIVWIILAVIIGYLLLMAAVIGTVAYLITGNIVGRNPFGSKPDVKVEEHLEIQETPFVPDEEASPDGTLSVKQIAKKVRPSVVGVVANGSSDNLFAAASSSVGSGIIMSEDGYIITNNHVVENTNSVAVILDDGTEYGARVIGTDARTDLAVLKIEARNLPVATFGDSGSLEQGDLAVAIGNPSGLQLQNTVTSGVISAINRDIIVDDQPMTLIQTDASINPGNSGGPLVNAYGQVIGINTVKIGVSYYEGLGFAIPINSVKPIVDELISRGYIKGRPTIGISGEILDERTAAYFNVPAGMYVEYVAPNSDAYQKGLQRGDIIVKVNGQEVRELGDIQKIRDEHVAGDSIELSIYRNGTTKNIRIVLMDEAEMNRTSVQQN